MTNAHFTCLRTPQAIAASSSDACCSNRHVQAYSCQACWLRAVRFAQVEAVDAAVELICREIPEWSPRLTDETVNSLRDFYVRRIRTLLEPKP